MAGIADGKVMATVLSSFTRSLPSVGERVFVIRLPVVFDLNLEEGLSNVEVGIPSISNEGAPM